MELDRAKTLIHERYIVPMNASLLQLCGPSREEDPITVHVNWQNSVERWFETLRQIEEADEEYDDNGEEHIQHLTEEQELHVQLAEMSVQVLQLPMLWDALRKAVARYLCEDRSQIECFNDNIDKIVIEFIGDENAPATHLQLRKEEMNICCIVYTINLRVEEASEAILSAIPLFKKLDIALGEFVTESEDEESNEDNSMDTDISSDRRKLDAMMDVESSTTGLETSGDHDTLSGVSRTQAQTEEDGVKDDGGDEDEEDTFEDLDVDDFDTVALAGLEKKIGLAKLRRLRRGREPSPSSDTDSSNSGSKKTRRSRVSSMFFHRSWSSHGSLALDTMSNTNTDMDDNSDDSESTSVISETTLSDDSCRDDYEGDEYGAIEDEDLETDDVISDLQRVARRHEVARKRDLSKLFRLLQLSDNYWNPNDKESMIIEQCLQILNRLGMMKPKERFVKAWSITKVNKKGMNQARYLLLTDRKFFTLKFDPERNVIDSKHVKFQDLKKFVMVDVGRFRQASSDKKMQPYAMCLYTTNNNDKNIKSTLEVPNEQTVSSFSSVTSSHQPDQGDNATSEDAVTELHSAEEDNYDSPELGDMPKEKKRGKLEKIASHGGKYLKKKIDKSFRGKSSKTKTKDDDWTIDRPIVESLERPDTSGMTNHYFMANNQIHQSDFQKRFLEEIAWSVYCVAVSRNATFDGIFEPFDTQITRPTSTSAKLYNKFKMGMAKGRNKSKKDK